VGVVEQPAKMGALELTRYWVITVADGMTTASPAWTYRGAMVIVAELLKEGYRWVPNVDPSWLP
jgi:hypothetical protein